MFRDHSGLVRNQNQKDSWKISGHTCLKGSFMRNFKTFELNKNDYVNYQKLL